MKKLFLFLALMSFLNIYAFAQKEEKLTASQIIEKHLAAIGTPEKRALNRIVVGNTICNTNLLASQKDVMGKTAITSDKSNVLFLTAFSAVNYTGEQLAYNGKNLSYGVINTSASGGDITRKISPLTFYVTDLEEIFSHGLIGGALSSAWALQTADAERRAKIEVSNKKVDGRESYILKYIPRDANFSPQASSINIYIDKSTFQHYRTEYKKTINGVGSLDQVSVDVNKYLTENFSDFKTENGLTLPHKYEVRLETNSSRTKWDTTFSSFMFDQKLDPAYFVVRKNPA